MTGSGDGETQDDGLLCGVFLTETGIFRRTEEGVQKIRSFGGTRAADSRRSPLVTYPI